MNVDVTRRHFLGSCAAAAGALVGANELLALSRERPSASGAAPIRLGLASYTFRNFSRAQLISFMKQLKVYALNAKDTKDHLPEDPQAEAAALADYAAAGITLHAAGTIYFEKNDDADIHEKFQYCQRAGIGVIVAGDPTPETLPRVEKFAKDYDTRIAIHNHGPEDKLWHSPLDVLQAVKNMDPRMGCCIDVGHTVRAGTDVVSAIHAAGPRLFNMHMKDLADFHEKDSQVAVGAGKMPVKEIFEALAGIKYQGFVDLEYEIAADDPMPGVSNSFAYMRGLLAGLGYNRGE
jgi:sugar phosphate isomerase/epimerase